MKYIIYSTLIALTNCILSLGIADFELSTIRAEYILHESNKSNIKSQWCRQGNNLANNSVFCNSYFKGATESKIFKSDDNSMLVPNSNIPIGNILDKSVGLVNQLPLQDQNLRDALSHFGNNYLISIQPMDGLDMSLGSNQIKLNYKY
jgi:hypothetical protein